MGIALLTHGCQFPTAGASENVCNQFEMGKKLEQLVCDPVLDFLVVFQLYECLVQFTKASLSGNDQLCVEG